MQKTSAEKRAELVQTVQALDAALGARYKGMFKALTRFSAKGIDKVVIIRQTQSNAEQGAVVEIP